MNTQNIMIKAQNGSRIPYDKILSISPTRCGSEPNDFAIVAIFNTDNKAYPKDILFQGTEEECNKWLDWLDGELKIDFPENAIYTLEYPEKSIWLHGRRISVTKLEKIKQKYFKLEQEYRRKVAEANDGRTFFNRVKIKESRELIKARGDYIKYW